MRNFFQFADPVFLLLLFPVLTGVYFVSVRRTGRGLTFPSAERIALRRVSRGRIMRDSGAWLVTCALALSVSAMARPQITKTASEIRKTAAIAMAVDISGSMRALDMTGPSKEGANPVSRLDMVKMIFSGFVEKKTDYLAGLITFGGYAVTRSPLTSDHNALSAILGEIEIPDMASGTTGLLKDETLTAIGDALVMSCARLRDADVKGKAVILLSDGVSNSGVITPDQAILTARELGIRVYTIGIGSTGTAPFWDRDEFGRKVLRHEEVEMDETLLQRIADETGGRYYNVTDGNSLSSAMEKIDSMEKSPAIVSIHQESRELFPMFLVPAIFMLMSGACLGITASGRPV